jgi:hypothetical protein
MTKFTQIVSNGWAAQASIEHLLALLGRESLSTDMNRIEHEGEGTFRMFGSFQRVSHVFDVRSNDEAVLKPLMGAMMANRQSAVYQADAQYRTGAHDKRVSELQKSGDKEALAWALREWELYRPAAPSEMKGCCLTGVDARRLGL